MRRFLMMLLSLLLLTACEHQQQLCFDHESHDRQPVNVVFDWSLHPEAKPVTMSLVLFPDQPGHSLRYELKNRDGQEIMAPVGTYTAIAINSDSEAAEILVGDGIDDFEIRLRDAYDLQGLSMRSDAVPRAPGAESERMASQPDSMWRARVNNFTVSSIDTERTLAMTPEEAVLHYSFEITGVKNLSGIVALSGTLSGMSGSLKASDGNISDEKVTIPFDLSPADETTIRGTVRTFGHCGVSRARSRGRAETHSPHYFTLYAVLADGTRWYQTYDVSDQLKSNDSATTPITVDGLELPQVVMSGGFQVDIDNWNTVNTILPI